MFLVLCYADQGSEGDEKLRLLASIAQVGVGDQDQVASVLAVKGFGGSTVSSARRTFSPVELAEIDRVTNLMRHHS